MSHECYHRQYPHSSTWKTSIKERLPVSCIGDLIKEGNIFILKNPRQFTLDEAWKN
ncbi:hypothetical protein MC7420_733 [Coleofasciculus chthonoplastes PCC 7420]|uniref:Uncharacterized protein n=1 Tax=Coleofasciculus chthonoplastes PCC 7420 TaxID=118168 RepID=B4VTE3_9CYAN|nr:hypothetical protein MC7420_733 [Coleofasciculus chthonoplastes PCC 7420]